MNSINNKEPFSFEAFERGLMLAGLISPSTVTDLHEREVLEAHEKEEKSQSGKLYFKRAVLAAEIASELCGEPTFGRIKFQKLVYLCEHVSQMKLEHRYTKQAAGPFDNKFMHSIEKEFKKQGWFSIEKVKDGVYNKSKYSKLSNCTNFKKYYQSYFQEQDKDIHHIINLFRRIKTDQTEIAATLLACAIELSATGEKISNNSLLKSFYSWSDQKSQYNEKKVLETWEWMKSEGLVDADRINVEDI